MIEVKKHHILQLLLCEWPIASAQFRPGICKRPRQLEIRGCGFAEVLIHLETAPCGPQEALSHMESVCCGPAEVLSHLESRGHGSAQVTGHSNGTSRKPKPN